METTTYTLKWGFFVLYTRFPLGSGINGNSSWMLKWDFGIYKPASLWEVESMETIVSLVFSTSNTFFTRFPLGSGINGNLGIMSLKKQYFHDPLPSGKWNQWKHLDVIYVRGLDQPFPKTRFPLGSGINGNTPVRREEWLDHDSTRFPLGSGINGN